MENNKFLIIDGNSLVYRAFFALPLLRTSQGYYTNAVFGFTTMLFRLLEEEKPSYAAVAFDKGTPTFRHREYAAYKGTRDKTPSELVEQISLVREVLRALGIPAIEAEGYEADDLIGTIAQKAAECGISPLIVSGDADVFQLADIPAEVIYSRRGITQVERLNEKTLLAQSGLTPAQLIDYKGLMGDSSDNIPGVPGVGKKTALSLLESFGTLEGVYNNLEAIKGRLQETLRNNREQAFLSKRLATIVRNIPLVFNKEDFYRRPPDYDHLRDIFGRLEFKSLLEKLPAETAETWHNGKMPEEILQITDWNYLSDLIRSLPEPKSLAVITDPVDLPWREKPCGLAVALAERSAYLPIKSDGDMSGFMRILSGHNVLTITHDSKTWINHCRRWTYRQAERLEDVSLAAYLLDPLENGYPISKLSQRYLNRQLPKPLTGTKGEAPAQDPVFCTAAARALYDLYPLLQDDLVKSSLDSLYHELELPLAAILAAMEQVGVAVDLTVLNDMKGEFTQRLKDLETKIYELAGCEFNLNSPKQLGQILFDRLGLPVLKKTKTGNSTDAQVLEELAPRHEIAAKILQYRTLGKILTTYLEGLSKLVNPKTGRIHSTFNQTVTATGRLSSTEPNLQNIPIRLEEGRRVRRAFVPGSAGQYLLSADYSQIELRILAHISRDSVLIDAFCKGEDIHRRTAAEVFGITPEEVSGELRDRAKAVNFGIIYGISDYGLSRQLGIPRQVAKEYIQRYLERLPGVRAYLENIVEEARSCGYVTTILNRRRFLPDINSRNLTQRSFAERTAMNTPIQGSAADIIKLAMLRVARALEDYKPDAQLILQVHDDLIFEVNKSALYPLAGRIRDEMENVMDLSVPLTVDLKYGVNWAEMTKI